MTRLKQRYHDEVIPSLVEKFGYSSVMQVPKLVKITLNMGLGEAVNDKNVAPNAQKEMSLIAGQWPVITRTKKSIAGFKIRDGWPIGCKVTLRRDRMYEFLERVICIYAPRIRDFHGFSHKSFDGQGNYNFGIKEQTICPEIRFDKVDATRGFDVAVTTTAETDQEARALLDAFNFPFSDRGAS